MCGVFYVFYAIAYPFLNSSIDTVEELSFFDVMTIDYINHYRKYPYPSAAEEYEKKLQAWSEKNDINLNEELYDALDDSESVSDIKIKVVNTKHKKLAFGGVVDQWDSKIDTVQVSFTSEKYGAVSMRLVVTDKTLYPPYNSKHLSVLSITVGNFEYSGENDLSDQLIDIYFHLDDKVNSESSASNQEHNRKTQEEPKDTDINLCEAIVLLVGDTPDKAIEYIRKPNSIVEKDIASPHDPSAENKYIRLEYNEGFVDYIYVANSNKYIISDIKLHISEFPEKLKDVIPKTKREFIKKYGNSDTIKNNNAEYSCPPEYNEWIEINYNQDENITGFSYSGYTG
jgi:hypothetical protein